MPPNSFLSENMNSIVIYLYWYRETFLKGIEEDQDTSNGILTINIHNYVVFDENEKNH